MTEEQKREWVLKMFGDKGFIAEVAKSDPVRFYDELQEKKDAEIK